MAQHPKMQGCLRVGYLGEVAGSFLNRNRDNIENLTLCSFDLSARFPFIG
jgi:hypothetical protein